MEEVQTLSRHMFFHVTDDRVDLLPQGSFEYSEHFQQQFDRRSNAEIIELVVLLILGESAERSRTFETGRSGKILSRL